MKKVRYIAWIKDGYWYLAGVDNQTCDCAKRGREVLPHETFTELSGYELLSQNGGAYFYGK